KLTIEVPAAGLLFRCILAETGCEKLRVVPIVEEMNDGVFIQNQVRGTNFAGCDSVSKLGGERLKPGIDAPDVGARPIRVFDRKTPDGLAFLVVRPERSPFALGAFRLERIAVC